MVCAVLADANITVGSTAKLETAAGLVFEGIVLSFDTDQKVLVVDTKETIVGKPLVRIFNVQHLKNIKLLAAPEATSLEHASKKNDHFLSNNPITNNQKSNERYQKTVQEVAPNTMMSSNVSPRGQHVYIQLKRTIADTRWSGDSIRVLGLVVVHKPYGAGDVVKDERATGYDEGRAASAIAQVQKILAKPLNEWKARPPVDFTQGTTILA